MLATRFPAAFLMTATLMSAPAAFGQNYPNRPIRITANEIGGGTDLAARLIAPELTENLGQSIIVVNLSTRIAAGVAAKAPPDGYNLLLSGSAVWLTPFLRDNVPWDPIKDFIPISIVSMGFTVLVVHPSLPVKSVKELIALAKARPGELNYGAGGVPLPAELFKAMSGVNIVLVPYKGTGPAINDLLGGHVQVMFPSVGSIMPLVQAGRLRALAVGSAKPSKLAPNVPTMAAAGLPGYEATSFYGMLAPAKTPAPIISRLNQEVLRVLNRPDVKEKFLSFGVEAAGSSPEEFAVAIKNEMTNMGKVIKDNAIRSE